MLDRKTLAAHIAGSWRYVNSTKHRATVVDAQMEILGLVLLVAGKNLLVSLGKVIPRVIHRIF